MREVPPTPLYSWASRVEAHRAAQVRGRQRRCVFLAIAGCAAVMLPLAVRPTPRFVWNATPSSPTGLYLVTPGQEARLGDTVVAWLPDPARRLADRRHYVPFPVAVVKRVAAVGGDRVCADGARLLVGTRSVATRRVADARGRALPWWSGCRILAEDEVLLLAEPPDSFDGRYFGPVSRTLIVGSARLVWPW